MKKGLFITFEGCDGSGKSTQIALLKEALSDAGHEVVLLREPGGTKIGEKIREVLLATEHTGMSEKAELLLYEAARAQLVEECIKPALDAGTIVICDRFFDSTTAYQGFGRGLDVSFIDGANRWVAEGAIPDCTILLDVEPCRGHSRATKNEADRLEAEGVEFQERVREGYEGIFSSQDEARFFVVSASGSRGEIAKKIRQHLTKFSLFPEEGQHPQDDVSPLEIYQHDTEHDTGSLRT